MHPTRQTNVTAPGETRAHADRADCADLTAGRTTRYPSQNETIETGSHPLAAQTDAVENWLREQVGPACDALRADPSRAITPDQVRARLAAEYA